MAETRGITRNPNHIDASNRNTFQTCDNGGVAPWSGINHDVMLLVMMQLGVIDFVAFSGVCKSWRSLAFSNRKMFIASRLPMSIWISYHVYKKEFYCYLEDFEGRKFKTLLPDYGDGRSCIGITCGYLVFYAEKTRDFRLVNLITRHELNFPSSPCISIFDPIKVILVFSPSKPGWVLVVFLNDSHIIWYSTAGKGDWGHVTSPYPILDVHVFKGKIYTLHAGCRLCEFRLFPEPKLILLQDVYYREPYYLPLKLLTSWGENLYAINNNFLHPDIIYKLDFGKMKWVSPEENTIGEYAFFMNFKKQNFVIKSESWAAHLQSQCKRYEFFPDTTDKSRKGRIFVADMWYFPMIV